MLAGRLAYMAPEHPSSDIFALGAVMLELLTGRRLFDAKIARGMVFQGGATGGEMASTLQARSDTPYSHSLPHKGHSSFGRPQRLSCYWLSSCTSPGMRYIFACSP